MKKPFAPTFPRSFAGTLMCGLVSLFLVRAAEPPAAAPPNAAGASEKPPGASQAALYHLAPNQSPPVMPVSDDESGFVSIFDGKTLHDWDGDPTYWRVENGLLVGEVTPATLLHKRNSFIIWRGGTPHDFELKAEYRVSALGNSGINYRSIELPGLRWALQGYQADIEGPDRFTGQNYEERGRGFLAVRGQVNRIEEGNLSLVLGQVGDPGELQSFIKKEDWNEYHLIVRGNVLIHILNGHVMCVVIDDDVKDRRFDGLIGVQVHEGPPMKVEYRNIRLKTLKTP